MLLTLAFRHLVVRPLRSLFLLAGFALGVGVMIVLLSVGEAMLSQSRDVALVGGGAVTVLPQGIDIEAMRTGGLTGLFFTIPRARFVTRQVLGGPRFARMVRAVSPLLDSKLLYVAHEGRVLPVRAGAAVPSRASALDAGLDVRSGAWADIAEDSAWIAPTPQQLYDQLDHFHRPVVDDSTWGEWHYFNVVTGPEEWWYITLAVGGRIGRGSWGGQVLVTHRQPDGSYRRYSGSAGPAGVVFDTARADLQVGASSVEQRDGVYRVRLRLPGSAGVSGDITLQPEDRQYFPPMQLQEGERPSGYVVPALTARATGRFCVAGRCRSFTGAASYHDHNWGVWRDVTWDWGAAHGARYNFLYGRVLNSTDRSGESEQPLFVALTDSLGLWQVLRAPTVAYSGRRPARGAGRAMPTSARFTAARGADTVHVVLHLDEGLGTALGTGGFTRRFVQMRGRFHLRGRIAGQAVSDSGSGFFETWLRAGGTGEGKPLSVRKPRRGLDLPHLLQMPLHVSGEEQHPLVAVQQSQQLVRAAEFPQIPAGGFHEAADPVACLLQRDNSIGRRAEPAHGRHGLGRLLFPAPIG